MEYLGGFLAHEGLHDYTCLFPGANDGDSRNGHGGYVKVSFVSEFELGAGEEGLFLGGVALAIVLGPCDG